MLVKFYCGIITRSRLQLINTLIDTFYNELRIFLTEKEEQGRPIMAKRKLHGVVEESSEDKEIRKSEATT